MNDKSPMLLINENEFFDVHRADKYMLYVNNANTSIWKKVKIKLKPSKLHH